MTKDQRPLYTLLLANVALVLAYLATGRLGLMLALPPGFATPWFPPAGIALAVLFSGGWRYLPGLILGSLLLNFYAPFPGGEAITLMSVVGGAAAAVGAAAQAALGAMLFRRWIHSALGAARDILLFLLLTPLVCCVSASISLGALLLLGAMSAETFPAAWLTWWVGDTIGVLLAAPLCWVLFGQPRGLWRRRRTLLAIPLLLSAAAFIAIYEQAVRWEHDQQTQTLRLKGQQASDLLQAQLDEYQHFLKTMARALSAPDHAMTGAEFAKLARSYVGERPELSGMAWLARVPDAGRAEFERWGRANIDPSFRIHDLGLQTLPPGARPEYYPVLFIEPIRRLDVIGSDFLADPVRAGALQAALASHKPAASALMPLIQRSGKGVALLQVVEGAVGSDKPVAVLGMALRLDAFLARVLDKVKLDGMAVDFEDVSEPGRPSAALAQIGHPLRATDQLHQLQFGGRHYQLRLAPTDQFLSQHRGWQSWTVLTCGLLLTGLLGALMLMVSSERARIQSQVKNSTAQLREREARLQAILDNAADAILTVADDGSIIAGNAAAAALFGYATEQLGQLHIERLLPLPGVETAPELLQRLAHSEAKDRALSAWSDEGRSFPVSVAVSAVSLPDESLFVVIVRDLTEQQRSQERIYRLAHNDTLTGLENRFSLNLRLEQLLVHAKRSGEAVAVLFIDLDHFKKINDSQGHQSGDQLLIAVAQRLKDLLRDADTIARLGGDEFIVVMAGAPTPDAVTTVAVRIVEALAAPYLLDGKSAHSGASVGVAMFPADGGDPSTLLRHADTAMYAAKSQGRGNFQFFSAAMNAATHERLLLENRLWQALEQDEFELYLQPQVDLRSGAIVGAEALLRWHHPELGLVGPNRFIPIAEESGLILPLGEWVLARAAAILAGWNAEGQGHLRLAVNLSARQCHGKGLLPFLDALIAKNGFEVSRLELEITESAAMQDPERTRQLLRELRQRGIQVAIDDFGTGYSSLSYLKLFAIDRIKIDRSFVKDIETDPNDAVIVAATIALAHSLGLAVIAEGVETDAQHAFLANKGCEEAQGFKFAKPMPLADWPKVPEPLATSS